MCGRVLERERSMEREMMAREAKGLGDRLCEDRASFDSLIHPFSPFPFTFFSVLSTDQSCVVAETEKILSG